MKSLGSVSITGWTPYSPQSGICHLLYTELQEVYTMGAKVNAIVSFDDVRFMDCPIISYAEENRLEKICSDGDATLYIMKKTERQFEVNLVSAKGEVLLIPGEYRKMIGGIHRSLLPGNDMFSINLGAKEIGDAKDGLLAILQVIVSGDPVRSLWSKGFTMIGSTSRVQQRLAQNLSLIRPKKLFRAIFEKGYKVEITNISLKIL